MSGYQGAEYSFSPGMACRNIKQETHGLLLILIIKSFH